MNSNDKRDNFLEKATELKGIGIEEENIIKL